MTHHIVGSEVGAARPLLNSRVPARIQSSAETAPLSIGARLAMYAGAVAAGPVLLMVDLAIGFPVCALCVVAGVIALALKPGRR